MTHKRRGHKEGSIHRRKDGRWVGVASLGHAGGKRKRKYVYGKTQAEARKKLREVQRAVEDGSPVSDERRKLEDFSKQWLSDVVAQRVAGSTHDRYEQLLRCHLLPQLGARPIGRVSAPDLQGVYASLSGRLAPATILQLHRVIHSMLETAVDWGLVTQNVSKRVSPPKAAKKERPVLSEAQCKGFISALAGHEHEVLFVVALTTGMRQGELLGLKWGDLCPKRASLQVNRTLRRKTSEGLIESPPKTPKSRRRVPLTANVTAMLAAHEARQAEARLRLGSEWHSGDYVFTNEVGGPLDASNLLRRQFYPLLESAGLPRIRFHDLRHTAASLMLLHGVHPKVVQGILGHSQISVTLDLYSHVVPVLLDNAIAAVGAALWSKSATA